MDRRGYCTGTECLFRDRRRHGSLEAQSMDGFIGPMRKLLSKKSKEIAEPEQSVSPSAAHFPQHAMLDQIIDQ